MVVGARVGARVGAMVLFLSRVRDPLPGLKEPLLVSFGRMVDLDPFGLLLPFPKVEGETVAAFAVIRPASRSTLIFMFSLLVVELSCESRYAVRSYYFQTHG